RDRLSRRVHDVLDDGGRDGDAREGRLRAARRGVLARERRGGPRAHILGNRDSASAAEKDRRFLMLVLAIALAGAVGAPARYFVDAVVIDRSEGGLPLATFFINVSATFVLGVLTGFALFHASPATTNTIQAI